MKYFIGALVSVLVIIGVVLGFNWGKRSNSDDAAVSPAKTTSTVASSTASSATTLDLRSKGLTKVGADVYGKTDTTELLLSDNSLQTLPSEMGKMTNVRVFKIDHNLLDGSLIGEIRQMSRLQQLDVSYNKMTGMPAELGQLQDLQTLNYSYNKITGLPNELSNLKGNLKEFNLTGNPLTQDQIAKLKAQLPNTNIIF